MNDVLVMRRIIDFGTPYFNARSGGTEIMRRLLAPWVVSFKNGTTRTRDLGPWSKLSRQHRGCS